MRRDHAANALFLWQPVAREGPGRGGLG